MDRRVVEDLVLTARHDAAVSALIPDDLMPEDRKPGHGIHRKPEGESGVHAGLDEREHGCLLWGTWVLALGASCAEEIALRNPSVPQYLKSEVTTSRNNWTLGPCAAQSACYTSLSLLSIPKFYISAPAKSVVCYLWFFCKRVTRLLFFHAIFLVYHPETP
jgi:hypothetical protein